MDTTFTEKQLMRAYDRRTIPAFQKALSAITPDLSPDGFERVKAGLLTELTAAFEATMTDCHEAAERLTAKDDRNTIPGGDNGSEG